MLSSEVLAEVWDNEQIGASCKWRVTSAGQMQQIYDSVMTCPSAVRDVLD
jgi:hypothetical protein